MKAVFAVALAVAAPVFATGGADAQSLKQTCPSCDIRAQHALKAETGGSIKDARQAHISMRANILEADLGTARKARRLTQRQTDTLFKRVEAVRHATDRFVKKQGFLSAAERASYDRELDAVAMRICRS
ncbi:MULTISPECIES: hypothetical protein [unclassified Sphingomonas]|uniref:hypothetical protein n=1 Tax=unclassified Sphingomonas TaxID=196159 RepID=UPI0006FAA42E|nr:MULTISPECIES: hypothetical protein [unclassified Sphingomonas]KQS49617.1 hypothetical protein ASG20_11605 [Sphingomonas sp. Leaf198]